MEAADRAGVRISEELAVLGIDDLSVAGLGRIGLSSIRQPHERIAELAASALFDSIKEALAARNLDALMVYGDEYRQENLRYVCNFWPIFERGACFIPRRGEPIFVGAPEGEHNAREMCACHKLFS
jgi:hypothetical protein